MSNIIIKPGVTSIKQQMAKIFIVFEKRLVISRYRLYINQN
ncbi:Uncharacterized protein dnl_46330 [Desulfonema limicola]|uniref:Uncharacterized protein n=1 Tax=Desulfonema limicola TaxID=45656 RepID=A0A975GI50_9BACT|nr:Uncharacterized protein dnl_46330 [Desulfonema limicola]